MPDNYANGELYADGGQTPEAYQTGGDLIKSAMRKLGVYKPGEPIDDAEIIDNLEVLNTLIDALSAEGLMIPDSVVEDWPLVAGQSLYTIGVSDDADFDTTRPVRIDVLSSFIRDASGNDTPLKIMEEREYNLISQKASSNSIPSRLWYIQTYPLGRLQFDCPANGGTVYLACEKPLTKFADINQAFSLLPGYRNMLIYNLAVLLADEYDRPISATVGTLATQSKLAVKYNNFKPIMGQGVQSLPCGRGASFDFNSGRSR
jgi:hypothetical protein